MASSESGDAWNDLPDDMRQVSSLLHSQERRDAEHEWLKRTLGEMIGEWIGKGDYQRVRCLELISSRTGPTRTSRNFSDVGDGRRRAQVPGTRSPQEQGNEPVGLPELESSDSAHADRTMTETDDEQWLGLYLEEALTPADGLDREAPARRTFGSTRFLERMRRDPSPTAAHSIGMAWVAGRLTCPTRTQWSNSSRVCLTMIFRIIFGSTSK